jgi:hypothetical protein
MFRVSVANTFVVASSFCATIISCGEDPETSSAGKLNIQLEKPGELPACINSWRCRFGEVYLQSMLSLLLF